jgi:hypothetical protein
VSLREEAGTRNKKTRAKLAEGGVELGVVVEVDGPVYVDPRGEAELSIRSQ